MTSALILDIHLWGQGLGVAGLQDPLSLLLIKTLKIISERIGEKFPPLIHQQMLIEFPTRMK